jgi:hypothetical protein
MPLVIIFARVLPHNDQDQVKFQPTEVDHSRGQSRGDIELTTYLTDIATVGSVNLVLDLCITHERFGSISNPSFNTTLHYPSPDDVTETINYY